MGIRYTTELNQRVEKVANLPRADSLLQKKHTLLLLLSADGLDTVHIAQEIQRNPQTVKEIYSYSIYPALDARNQRHAVLKAVELGLFSLSQAQKNYVWDMREPLSYTELVTVHCLLRDCALPDIDVAKRVPQSYSQFRDNVLKAKVKLRVASDAQLVVITLAALATAIELELPPLPGETEAINRNLAFLEGVPYPYPSSWHTFLASTATMFPPTLKKSDMPGR